MNAAVFVNGALPGTKSRGRLSLSVTNVLAGLDGVLHGRNGLRGWGASVLPNAVLYRVKSFEPSSRRFEYEVNPRFGSTAPTTTMHRAPLRITLDATFDLGRSSEAQRLDQNLRLRPKLVGTRAPADSIKKRYMEQFSDFYSYMLSQEMSDSLALSMAQMRALHDERAALRAKADSMFGELAGYLATLRRDFDSEEALKRVTITTTAVWNAIYEERDFLKRVLSPGQLRLLPPPLFQMISNPAFRGRFYF